MLFCYLNSKVVDLEKPVGNVIGEMGEALKSVHCWGSNTESLTGTEAGGMTTLDVRDRYAVKVRKFRDQTMNALLYGEHNEEADGDVK